MNFAAMKYFTISSLFFLLFLAGCTSLRNQPVNTYFSFEFEDENYEIMGYTTENGDSVNFLMHRPGRTTIFRAIDLNQDGILDRVITGSIMLDLANEIYQEGIRQAREKGNIRPVENIREFELVHEDYRLIIQSYIGNQSYLNRFIIYDLQWMVIGIFWDDDSHGILTRREVGEMDTDDAQILYDLVLHHASEKNRIDKKFEERVIISNNDSGQ